MKLLSKLTTFIAPELNHLYTVPPHGPPDDSDCGWSCREHALHIHAVCAALGVKSQLCLGDFRRSSPVFGINMSGTNGDGHAWCRIDGVAPVDLSMTFKFFDFGPGPRLAGPIAGPGINGDYEVLYARVGGKTPQAPKLQNVIGFLEYVSVDWNSRMLAKSPYGFLHDPPPGPTSWHERYGQDIYAKISLHCILLAQRKASPIRGLMAKAEAPRRISEMYPDGLDRLLAMLKA